MIEKYKLHTWLIFSIVFLLAACGGPRVMMPTPNVYLDTDADPYATLHQKLKSTEVPLFYVTDRAPEKDENGNLKYGYGRIASLAFGSTVVDLGENLSWAQLLDSSEFTVYHLRRMIKYIASFSEVGKINIIAHSRGTDVALSALRELTIAALAAGIHPREKYKIHNFVLAAPDLDAQVTVQRIVGDYLTLSADRFTIYTSPADKAIGWSGKLFASPKGRIGNLQMTDLPQELRTGMERSSANFSIINFRSSSEKFASNADRFGHSYFPNAPTVSSGLILMLRDDLDPGPPGRPLVYLGSKFWLVPPGDPAKEPKPRGKYG